MGRRVDYLFIPVTGPLGSGEYFRAATLMSALQAVQPDCRIACCLHRDARVPRLPGIDYVDIDRSPTRETPAITAYMRAHAPRVVVFDSTSRQAQLRCAQRCGARIVYISSRIGNRHTGFQLRKLRRIAEHWVIAPPDQHALSRGERLRLTLAGRHTRVRFATAIMPMPDSTRAVELRQRLGLPEQAPFALFAPGGGGGRIGDQPIAAIFAAAAQGFADRSGMATLFVAGPQAAVAPPGHGELRVVHWVTPLEMANLLHGAALVVSGGGALLLQAYASGRRTVACPAGSSDQPARIQSLAALPGSGIRYADPRADALLEAALASLAEEAPRPRTLRPVADDCIAALQALWANPPGAAG